MASDSYQHYVGGEWIDGDGTETFDSVDPATRETLGTFPRGTPDEVQRAVSAAEAASESWREVSYIDRAEYLWDVFHLAV